MEAIGQNQFGLRKHHMTDNTVSLFHHKIQIRNKIWIITVTMQNIVLCATGTIYVPKSFTSEFFHHTIISWFFKSNLH